MKEDKILSFDEWVENPKLPEEEGLEEVPQDPKIPFFGKKTSGGFREEKNKSKELPWENLSH